MPKATTTRLPSPGLRDFIGALNEQRPDVERQVRLFALGARHAVAEFEEQVAPLDLSDRRHHAVASASGVDELLAGLERMMTALAEVVQR